MYMENFDRLRIMGPNPMVTTRCNKCSSLTNDLERHFQADHPMDMLHRYHPNQHLLPANTNKEPPKVPFKCEWPLYNSGGKIIMQKTKEGVWESTLELPDSKVKTNTIGDVRVKSIRNLKKFITHLIADLETLKERQGI